MREQDNKIQAGEFSVSQRTHRCIDAAAKETTAQVKGLRVVAEVSQCKM